MKFRPIICVIFLMLLAFIPPTVALAALSCQTVSSTEDTSIKTCPYPLQHTPGEYGVLTLATFQSDDVDIAYKQGYLLGDLIEKGALSSIVAQRDYLLSNLPANQRPLAESMIKCLANHFRASVPVEFNAVSNALYQGYRESSHNKFSEHDFFTGSVAAEMDIILEGVLKKFKENPAGAVGQLTFWCGIQAPVLAWEQLLKYFASKNTHAFKMGCTAAGASGDFTKDGQMIFGRNFDSALLGSAEKYPILALYKPKNGYRYVGVAPLGIVHAGGITGFNEKGIAVSLHELSTDEYALIDHMQRRRVPATYVQTEILKHAASIDEAYKIAQSYRHYGAWTIFVGDAKKGEFASIEFTGKNIALAERQFGSRAQSNHFLAPAMQNAFFDYSYNKTLESISRYTYFSASLVQDRSAIDTSWFINKLSSHVDTYEGLRSFGRTVTKVYQTATHIMLPESGVIWLSLGDDYPVSEGRFIGFKVNFNFDEPGNGTDPFTFLGYRKKTEAPPFVGFNESLRAYTFAYLAYARDHDNEAAYNHLSQAISLMQKKRKIEAPYHYIRGKLGLLIAAQDMEKNGSSTAQSLAYLNNSLKDFNQVLQNKNEFNRLHRYQKALFELYKARTTELLLNAVNHTRSEEVTLSLQSALSLLQEELSSTKRSYFLRETIASFYDTQKSQFIPYSISAAAHEKIEFVTIE